MKKILLGILLLYTYLLTSTQSTIALVGDFEGNLDPNIKEKIDTSFINIESRLKSFPNDTKIQIYLRLQEISISYADIYTIETHPEMYLAFEYIYGLAQTQISSIRGMIATKTNTVIEKIIEKTKEEIQQEEDREKVDKAFKIVSIRGSKVSVKDGDNLLIGEFRVSWEKSNTDIELYIQPQNDNYNWVISYEWYITLIQWTQVISQNVVNWITDRVVFENIDLSEWVYSIRASLNKVPIDSTLGIYMKHSPTQDIILLNQFIGTKEINIPPHDRPKYASYKVRTSKSLINEDTWISVSWEVNNELKKVLEWSNSVRGVVTMQHEDRLKWLDVTFTEALSHSEILSGWKVFYLSGKSNRNEDLVSGNYYVTMNLVYTNPYTYEEDDDTETLTLWQWVSTLMFLDFKNEWNVPRIIAWEIEKYKRQFDEIWEFQIQWPNFTLNELELELNIYNGGDDFEIQNGKIYIIDQNLEKIAENSGYSTENEKNIKIRFKDWDINLKEGKYTIRVQELSVDEDTELEVLIHDMEVNQQHFFSDELEDKYIWTHLSEVDILKTQ